MMRSIWSRAAPAASRPGAFQPGTYHELAHAIGAVLHLPEGLRDALSGQFALTSRLGQLVHARGAATARANRQKILRAPRGKSSCSTWTRRARIAASVLGLAIWKLIGSNLTLTQSVQPSQLGALLSAIPCQKDEKR